ncbi:uncharacterized protein [Amphiura filiformis]|uniref:uncharacterized protein isoform X2 n=1 Tax=Amphiura filiformis TaxID=82378 RepID=UPI003B227C44
MDILLTISAICGFMLLPMCVSQPAPMPTTPTHDMSCVVPPVPVNNFTGNQLVTLTVKSPWFPDPEMDRIRETLFETRGDCGLDVFVLEKGWIFDSLIPVGFSNYCRKLDPWSQTNLPQVNILSAGSLTGGIAPTLMPMPRRLPFHWRSGIIIWIHYDRVVAEHKPFQIQCNYPYTNILGGINVVLNVNATLTINGCPYRTYGAWCDQKCSYCAKGVNCNSFTGACICPKGFYGGTCETSKQGVRVNSDSVYLPFGETAHLTCTSYGFKTTAGRWTKYGMPQRSVSRIEDVNYSPKPLVVYTIIEAKDTSVDGVYTCEVMDDTGGVYTKTVNVTVIGVPDAFVEFPHSQEVTVGSYVSFRCSVKELTGRLVWYRGPFSFPKNATEMVSSARHRIITHSPLTSELFISDVRVEDDDVYKCFVGHVFTEKDLVFAQARLTVFVPTESRIVGFHEGEVLTHQEQIPLQLDCRADNTKPAPRVTWFVGDTVRMKGVFTETFLSEDGITYNINSRLIFNPTWKHDISAVKCVMENMAMGAVSQSSVYLDITYAPKVKTPARVSVNEGEEILIECLANANPDVTEYHWTVEHPNEPGTHSLSPSSVRGGEDVVPNANIDLAGQFDENIYQLRKADERHNDMIVTCTVYNVFGSGRSETHVEVQGKPAAMAAPVIGIGIMVALALLVMVVILQCFKSQIRSFCCASQNDNQDQRLMEY